LLSLELAEFVRPRFPEALWFIANQYNMFISANFIMLFHNVLISDPIPVVAH